MGSNIGVVANFMQLVEIAFHLEAESDLKCMLTIKHLNEPLEEKIFKSVQELLLVGFSGLLN